MNEFDELIKADRIKIAKQNEAKSEVKHLGKIHLQKGQKFWQLNLDTVKVEEVKISSADIDLNGRICKKFTVNPNCWYEKAINRRNAERKFLLRLKTIRGIK